MLMANMKSTLKRYLPQFTMDYLRTRRRKSRHLKIRQLTNQFSHTEVDEALLALGVQQGGVLCVHSGADWFRYYKPGLMGLLEQLQTYITPTGTLMMPVFPFSGYMRDFVLNAQFDQAKTPSHMGLITELFRRMPDVKRSLHPTHSVCAHGPQASWLVQDHHHDLTPFGLHSPFSKLVEAKGQVLLLGVDLSALTLVHVIEDHLQKKFPASVYLPEPALVNVRDAAGQQHQVKTFVHDPKMSERRHTVRFEQALLDRQIMRKISLQHVDFRLLDSKPFFDFMVECALADNTIYQ